MVDPSKLTPELLVHAYSQGAFPMAEGRGSQRLAWYSPDPRGVIPLDRFRMPKNLAKCVRQRRFHILIDRDFEAVIRTCAEPRSYQRETWINEHIIHAYCQLHEMGLAHSVEAWSLKEGAPHEPGELVGGLYGVSLRGAFFGESMFSRVTDASKVCLVHLVEHMKARGMSLLDIQFPNKHLAQFGACGIPREAFLDQLEAALLSESSWA
jgi:leucyl/phenylalanyl-tRNA--protein transferase